MAFAFVAYTIIFLGIAWYVFTIARQQDKLSRQIEALEAAVGSSEAAPGGAPYGAARQAGVRGAEAPGDGQGSTRRA